MDAGPQACVDKNSSRVGVYLRSIPIWGFVLGAAFLVSLLRPEGLTAISPFKACLLGLIQGVTEFLPVSSSGHLILAMQALGLADPSPISGLDSLSTQKLTDTLCVIFQGASALAVLVVLRRRIKELVFSGPGAWKPSWTRLALATVPAAGLGFLTMGFIKAHLFGLQTVAGSVLIGGFFMGAVALWQRQRSGLPAFSSWEHLPLGRVLAIGCMQCLALCPGMSRSMTTLTGGVLVGLSLAQSLELSLLLGLIIVTGTALYSLWDAVALIQVASAWEPLIWGSFMAFVSAWGVIGLMLRFLARYGLAPFAFYRIVLGAIFLHSNY